MKRKWNDRLKIKKKKQNKKYKEERREKKEKKEKKRNERVSVGNHNFMLYLFWWKTLCKNIFPYFLVCGSIRKNELKENYL